jgi:hypothetical protein
VRRLMKNLIDIFAAAALAFAFQAVSLGAYQPSRDGSQHLQGVAYNFHATLNRPLVERSRVSRSKSPYLAQNAIEAARGISLADSFRSIATVLSMPEVSECVFHGHAASSRAPPLA